MVDECHVDTSRPPKLSLALSRTQFACAMLSSAMRRPPERYLIFPAHHQSQSSAVLSLKWFTQSFVKSDRFISRRLAQLATADDYACYLEFRLRSRIFAGSNVPLQNALSCHAHIRTSDNGSTKRHALHVARRRRYGRAFASMSTSRITTLQS